jgi:hypothetical protein
MIGAHFTLEHTGESVAIVAMIRQSTDDPAEDGMAHIELPRALEDYFAFAETTATRNGRRFLISFPYFTGAGAAAKLDRLQWWYHMSPEAERQMGDTALATLKAQATERFRRHIERWLQNTRQRLHGDEPIPRIDPLADSLASTCAETSATAATAAPDTTPASVPAPEASAPNVLPWPGDKVANG